MTIKNEKYYNNLHEQVTELWQFLTSEDCLDDKDNAAFLKVLGYIENERDLVAN